MSHVIVEERRFSAPIDVVWNLVSDHRGLHRWLLPDMKVCLDPEGAPDPDGVGAVRVIERGGYQGREEVLVFEPPHALSYTVLAGFPIDNHLGEVTLSPQGEHTQLSWRVRFDARYPGTGWLLEALVRRVLRQGLDRAVALLARA